MTLLPVDMYRAKNVILLVERYPNNGERKFHRYFFHIILYVIIPFLVDFY